jgi:autotransporter-associated beta strand protein
VAKLKKRSALAAAGLISGLLVSAPARAQDATWLASPTVTISPGVFDFDANANWTPATAPTATASFGASNGSNISFSSGSTSLGGFTFNAGASNYVFTNNGFLTFNSAGIVINGGSDTLTNSNGGRTQFLNTSSAGSATITNNNATTEFSNTSTAGSATVVNNNGGQSRFLDTTTAGSAAITNNNNGFTVFNDTSTAGSATITNNSGGGTTFLNNSAAGVVTITNGGGTTQFFNNSTAGNAAITNNTSGIVLFGDLSSAGSATITNNASGDVIFLDNSNGSNARLINVTAGFMDFSGSAGPNNDHKLSAGSIEGDGVFFLGSNQLTVGGNNLSTTVTGVISDCGNGSNCVAQGSTGGSLIKAGTGTLTLSGIDTYTGATTVNGGTLEVNGSIATSSLTTVNSGAMLTGVGVVAATQVNAGGLLAPGGPSGPIGTLAVSGNLAFASGAIYLVQLNSSTASFANVTGTATLAGTVQAVGSFATRTYDILKATGGFGGTTFSGASLSSPNFKATLSYSATDVFLNLTANLGGDVSSGLGGNQQNVATTINNFFNSGGTTPAGFVNLFNLSGGALSNALTQLSGETATGSQQTTFDAMGMFMGLMTDPFMNRTGGFGGSSSSGYADESAYAARSNPTDAFAMFTKAPPVAPTFEQRWSVWAAGFGGSQNTSGDVAVGSNNTTSNIAGTAVGADYLISPNTLAGFALAGGGTNFSVANGGTGRSDLFQIGAYIRHNAGPAYISAALAYGWQDITTNRTVNVAGLDQLRAEFNANAWSGRVEGGYRYVSPSTFGIGITPYAAAQFVTFDLPAYMEQAISGSNQFALGYNAKDETDVRSELGVRADKSWAVSEGIMTLRGRLAWAHDYDPDRSIAATFQSLPGASFVVNGAAQAADSALATASIEMKWKSGWSAAATFEGEFSNVTSSYAGKGVVHYQW